MMEGESLPDIETAGDIVLHHQLPGSREKFRKNAIIVTAAVALVALVATGVSVKTRRLHGRDSVDTQAVFLTRSGDETLAPTSVPPNLMSGPPTGAASPKECTIGGFCTEEGATCAFGEETCCGETYNSTECECSNGEWLCLATDACFRPDCNTTAPTAALPSSCDYSSSGKFCVTDDDCTCGDVCLVSQHDDFSVCGCEVNTTNGCDPNSDRPFCYKGYTASGVDCGCRDDDDCEVGETCGTSWCFANIVPYCSVDHNSGCPPTLSPVGSETSPPTNDPTPEPSSAPTQEPTNTVTASPTPRPTAAMITATTLEPTGVVTAVLTPAPTETSTGNVTTAVTSVDTVPSIVSNATEPRSSCVNIKFTSSRNFPKDNGYTFLSTKSGEVIREEKAGFMKEPQTEYFSQMCDLVPGSYTLVVTDEGGDGMFADGEGSYVVDIDGHVILVGGRFRKTEISHEIVVGIQPIMSKVDQEFLDAHNSRRQKFHESQDVSFRPMAWSPELAAGASAWAKERAKTCSNDNKEPGAYGQNTASQKLIRPDLARTPDLIVGWWMNKFDPEQNKWDTNLLPGSAVMWRGALYVGCAAEIAPIEDCPPTERACYCQVTNCRYVRTTNCAVSKFNWLDDVLDDNGVLCKPVVCPGADENGVIVEGACHA